MSYTSVFFLFLFDILLLSRISLHNPSIKHFLCYSSKTQTPTNTINREQVNHKTQKKSIKFIYK